MLKNPHFNLTLTSECAPEVGSPLAPHCRTPSNKSTPGDSRLRHYRYHSSENSAGAFSSSSGYSSSSQSQAGLGIGSITPFPSLFNHHPVDGFAYDLMPEDSHINDMAVFLSDQMNSANGLLVSTEDDQTPTHTPHASGSKRTHDELNMTPTMSRPSKRSSYSSLGHMSMGPGTPTGTPRSQRHFSGTSRISSSSYQPPPMNPGFSRSVSYNGPHAGPSDRIVSTDSMLSMASTQLQSPHMIPQDMSAIGYSLSFSEYGSGYDTQPAMIPTISTSLVPGINQYMSSQTQPGLYGGLSLESTGSRSRTTSGSMSISLSNDAPSPSSSTIPAYANQQQQQSHSQPLSRPMGPPSRSQTLQMIPENEQDDADLQTPPTEMGAIMGTPAVMQSGGMPSHPTLPAHPGYAEKIQHNGAASQLYYDSALQHWPKEEGYEQAPAGPMHPHPSQMSTFSFPPGHTHTHGQRSISHNYIAAGAVQAPTASYTPRPSNHTARSASESYIQTSHPYAIQAIPPFHSGSYSAQLPAADRLPGPSSAPMVSSSSLPSVTYSYPTPGMSWIEPTPSHARSRTIPTTPSKRVKYPPVGNPLKPGPKPKTPKKLKRQASGSSDTGLAKPEPSSATSSSSTPIFGGPLPQTQIDGAAYHSSSQATDISAQGTPALAPAMPSFDQGIMPARMMQGFSPDGEQQEQQPMLVLDAPASFSSMQGSKYTPDILASLFAVVTDEEVPGGPRVKRYRCMVANCTREFPRKSAVMSHIQTHLDDKPHKCPVEDCGAAFVRCHDLRRHKRIHQGEKPYPCECGKGFARRDALARHQQRNICVGGQNQNGGPSHAAPPPPLPPALSMEQQIISPTEQHFHPHVQSYADQAQHVQHHQHSIAMPPMDAHTHQMAYGMQNGMYAPVHPHSHSHPSAGMDMMGGPSSQPY